MKAHTVITQKDAKRITGGRTPLMPVQFESALKALQACIDLDEAKYWSDKADALAAWAKIYHSDEAQRKAHLLKLHAYRRMGQLAQELRPRRPHKPGPITILLEQGLTQAQSQQIRSIAKIEQSAFDKAVTSPNPPSIRMMIQERAVRSGKSTLSWSIFGQGYASRLNATQFRSFCRNHPPVPLARGLHEDEVDKARAIAIEISEWLDAFEQALPKQSKERSR